MSIGSGVLRFLCGIKHNAGAIAQRVIDFNVDRRAEL
jgi:hypothetical protein